MADYTVLDGQGAVVATGLWWDRAVYFARKTWEAEGVAWIFETWQLDESKSPKPGAVARPWQAA